MNGCEVKPTSRTSKPYGCTIDKITDRCDDNITLLALYELPKRLKLLLSKGNNISEIGGQPNLCTDRLHNLGFVAMPRKRDIEATDDTEPTHK